MLEQNIPKQIQILLPTYNERENIKLIIPEIFNIFPEINILVIDDNSPDKTAEIVEELMGRYHNLNILKRQNKTGLGDAYKDGMKQVFNDDNIKFVITMDADGSHSPEYLKEFLYEVNNYDLIIGSRYVNGGSTENWELWRKYLSFCGNLCAKILTGMKINDFTAGFMCIKKEYLARVNFSAIDSFGYSFLIELKYSLIKTLGARVKEVPIIFRRRLEGESKISKKIVIEGFLTLWRLLLKRVAKKFI